MPIKVVTAPAEMPVTLSEVKAFCNVTIDLDDAMLTSFIAAATADAEHFTGMRFITQTLDLYLDAFPAHDGVVEIPGPVASVASVKYIDADGVEQTMDSADYVLDPVSNPARLVPAFEKEWPETREQFNAVVIRFVQGEAASACPDSVKTFIKAHVRHVYDGLPGGPTQAYMGLLASCRKEFPV